MNNSKEVILGVISRLADITFQNDVWVNKKYNDSVFYLGEAIEILNDYSFFDDVENRSLVTQSEIEQEYLEKYISLLLKYDYNKYPVEITRDRNWIEIVDMSKKVLVIIRNMPEW